MTEFIIKETSMKEISFIKETPENSSIERGFLVWDETYSDYIGVYPTFFEAKINLKAYSNEFLSYNE